MEKLKRILMLVILWVGSIMATIGGKDVEKAYDERGIEVTATIIEVIPKPRYHTDYVCTYYNAQGQKIRASLILNQFEGEVGQVVVGKYLPESPEIVQCEASDALKYGVLSFMYLLTILYTAVLFVSRHKNDEDAEIARIYEKYNVKPPQNVYDDFDVVENKTYEQNINCEEIVEEEDVKEELSHTGLRLKT